MPLTQQAIDHDKSSGIPLIPMHLIYADQEFNCRGTFTANDIIELVKDVATRGLLEPIILRHVWDNELEIKQRGFQYSLVAGFRRFASYRANEAEFIPGIIRKIESDFDCHDINAVENLQRKDLTLWQESKSIKHYWMAGWTREQVAERVNKSQGWVQVRYMLLSMEPEIQQAADQGYIQPGDLRELNKFTGAERLKVAGVIRDARKKGEGKNIIHKVKKKDRLEARKARSKTDMMDMMDHLRTTFKNFDREQMVMTGDLVTVQGNTLTTRMIAWIAGEISSLDIYTDIKKFCHALGYEYELPEFDP